jgi:hypothetical protein
MNRLALFLLGVGAGLTVVSSLNRRHPPAIEQALYERRHAHYLH